MPLFMARYSLRGRRTRSSRPPNTMPEMLKHLKTKNLVINQLSQNNQNLTQAQSLLILSHSINRWVSTPIWTRSKSTRRKPAVRPWSKAETWKGPLQNHQQRLSSSCYSHCWRTRWQCPRKCWSWATWRHWWKPEWLVWVTTRYSSSWILQHGPEDIL